MDVTYPPHLVASVIEESECAVVITSNQGMTAKAIQVMMMMMMIMMKKKRKKKKERDKMFSCRDIHSLS